MLQSIDGFLDRQRGRDYNCFDFAAEVWAALTGEDIRKRVQGLARAISARKARPSDLKGFKRLEQPANPCFVLMQRRKFVPHIGIYLDGRILHLTDKGVQFMPLMVARQYYVGAKYYR